MKKLILLIIATIILTTVFTACNTQENTQETSETATVVQTYETVVNETSSQAEQVQAKTYVGEWKYSFMNFGNEIDTVLTINEDGTFTITSDDDWETYGSQKIKSQSGTYIEESNNRIILSIEKAEIYNPRTEENEIATMPTNNTSSDNIMYFTIKDSNTLILENSENGNEITEITRIS